MTTHENRVTHRMKPGGPFGFEALCGAAKPPDYPLLTTTTETSVTCENCKRIASRMTKPPQLTEDAVREIEARANAATEGPWESDNEQDSEHRYQFYMALDAESRTIFDTLNSSVGEIHEEADEDGVYRWDEVARRNIAFATHARTDIPALIRDWRAMHTANEWQKSSIEHFQTAISGCAERLAQTTHENAALRAQLAEARTWIDRKNAAIETWQQQAREYASQLAQVTSERDAARRELEILNSLTDHHLKPEIHDAIERVK